MARDYIPGFSPEEIESRKNHNPSYEVMIITQCSEHITESSLMISKKTQRLQEMCNDWKPEYYDEYVDIVGELIKLFRDVFNSSRVCADKTEVIMKYNTY